MTDARRAELVAIAEAATPGPRRFVKRVQVRPRSRRYRLDTREDEEVMFGSTNGAVVVCPSVEGTGGIHVAADERFAVECDRATVLALLREAEQCDALRELLWTLYEGLYGHRQAEGIDPFATAVGGALEVRKAFRQAFDVTMPQLRHEVAAAEARVLELLALRRDLAAAEARLAERDELRHAALAKADEAMNAKLAERKRCEAAERERDKWQTSSNHYERRASLMEHQASTPGIQRLIAERDGYKGERDAAVDALRDYGYRACDIPACNCGLPWAHGGHAETRLREISDAWQNTERENASLRARVAAAERLARGARELHTCVASGLHPILPGLKLQHALDAVRDALAAWDATATDATGRKGSLVRDEEKA